MSTPPDLGPLPEPGRVVSEPPSFYKDDWKHHKLYTAAQLKAERQRCYMLGVAAERERCAKLLDPSNADRPDDWTEYAKVRAEFAALIRAAAPSEPTKEGG